jgi:spore maturation protein CgeB
MRIFTAIRHSNDPRYFYGGLWSQSFYSALRELGHEVVESQTDLLRSSCFMNIATNFTPDELEVRAETTDRIVNEVRRARKERPLELFLGYFYNSHFDPAGFGELRRLNIPSANFYCNSIHQLDLVREIAGAVDI